MEITVYSNNKIISNNGRLFLAANSLVMRGFPPSSGYVYKDGRRVGNYDTNPINGNVEIGMTDMSGIVAENSSMFSLIQMLLCKVTDSRANSKNNANYNTDLDNLKLALLGVRPYC